MKNRSRPSVWTRIKSACVDAVADIAKQSRIFNTESLGAWFSGSSWAGKRATEKGVLQLSTASACVRLISETISTLPVRLLRQQADGSSVSAKDHNLYALLHDSPAAGWTAAQFWQCILACLLLRGNAYVEKMVGSTSGVITSLKYLLPDNVSPQRTGGVITGWKYVDPYTGVTRDIPKSRMWHITGFSLTGEFGLSPVGEFGAQVFGTALAVESGAAGVFRDGMKSPGILAANGFSQLNDVQRETFRKRINAASAKGEPLILEKDTTWIPLTFSPQDAQLLASRAFSVEEVCRLFGVPPFMVGHMEKTTSWGSGIEDQMIGFVQFVLRRWAVRIEQSAKLNLLNPVEQISLSMEFNMEGLLRGNSAARAAFYATMTSNGLMSRDECRLKEGLPAMGGNAAVLTVQSAMIPIDSMSAGDPAAAAAKSGLLAWLNSEEKATS